MKILSLHCDYIKFKPVKPALKTPEELSADAKKEKEVKEPLVIFTAVEKGDSPASADLLVENIKDIARQVKAKTIVLYPYAHLSPNLALPDVAIRVMKDAECKLKKQKEKFKVIRAPFGYYKEFELRCKGHPLAELSRSIGINTEIKTGKKIKVLRTEEKYDAKQLLREISKSKLDREKLKDNDHRILGQQMDLFSFSEVAPGMVFWHNNGLIIRNKLIEFWREEHKKAGYQEILTPQILDKRLWQISGHWEKYRENIFLTKYEGREFAVKPMNCPGGMLIYKNSPNSYRDLPLRIAELGIVHRQELSGVLGGLFRVIQFTQDDAHIFCTDEKQLELEVIGVIELTEKIYKKFGFTYHIELSTKPEKRIGNNSDWNKAEKVLESVLKKRKIKYKINKGEGAFYGPKIDFHIKDSLGRTWQCGTIQLDFAMPERFNLEYAEKDNKMKRPIMIHRAIYGSLERFIGVLLEHTNGRLPTWLAPVQVKVLSFTERNTKSAKKLCEELEEAGIRADADLENNTINEKVRNAELQKIPYIITIGDKEEKSKAIAVRRDGKVKSMKKKTFLKNLLEEIKERK